MEDDFGLIQPTKDGAAVFKVLPSLCENQKNSEEKSDHTSGPPVLIGFD
jgi:hypothetical protein